MSAKAPSHLHPGLPFENKAGLVLRQATPDDADLIYGQLKKLAEHEGKPDFLKISLAQIREQIEIGFENALFLICEVLGKPAGLVILGRRFSPYSGGVNLVLIDLFFEKEYRGRGLGKAVFEFLKLFSIKHGYSSIEWFVDRANADAKIFYKKIGGRHLDYSELWRLSVRS